MRLALLSAAGLGSSFTKVEGFISRVVFYSCMHALNDTGWHGGGAVEHCILFSISYHSSFCSCEAYHVDSNDEREAETCACYVGQLTTVARNTLFIEVYLVYEARTWKRAVRSKACKALLGQ